MQAIWYFLSDPTNQRTLGFLGGGLVVVVGAIWAVFTYLHPPGSLGKKDIDVTDDRFLMIIEASMAKADERHAAELDAAEAKADVAAAEAAAKIHALEVERLNAQLANKDKAIATLKENLAAASALVTASPEAFSRSEIEAANSQIKEGKTAEAMRLLEQVAARGTTDAAAAEFLLGKLAEGQADLVQAARHFRRAVELDPDNVEFRDHENSLYRITVVYDSGLEDKANKIADALTKTGLNVSTDHWTDYREDGDGAMRRWVEVPTFLFNAQTEPDKIAEIERTLADAGVALETQHLNGLNKHGTTWSFGLFGIFLWLPATG